MRFNIRSFKLETNQMNCNIKDVARLAGVSVGTVSRVINGSDTVAGKRVDAVRKAMSELGYQKNSAAQLLAGKRGNSRLRTGNIGLWMSEMADEWITNPVYINYLSGIESVCAARGYHVLIEHGGSTGYPRCVHEGKVDGLIVKAVNRIPEVLTELNAQLPLIGLSMFERELPLAQVATDNQLAGEEVCRYLWMRGHRRIGFVSTNDRHRMFFSRRTGYEYYMRQLGAYDSALVYAGKADGPACPEENFPDLHAAVDKLFSCPNPPTAVIAANDWMAAGLYEALTDRNLRIPDDVSVIAFDHLTNLFLRPRLTSYAVPMYEMGRTAAEWVLDMIDAGIRHESSGPEFRMVSGRIFEHASVGAFNQVPAELPSI